MTHVGDADLGAEAHDGSARGLNAFGKRWGDLVRDWPCHGVPV
jgi:hypothetical protein